MVASRFTPGAPQVQRPGAAALVAADLNLLAAAAPRLASLELFAGVLDVPALVDEWGRGFVRELDYRQEAGHAAAFLGTLRGAGLAAVTAPAVVPEASARTVLTSTWVAGVPIDRAPPADRGRLAALALAAYLSMMLDAGVLHCDPHPARARSNHAPPAPGARAAVGANSPR